MIEVLFHEEVSVESCSAHLSLLLFKDILFSCKTYSYGFGVSERVR